MNFLLDTHAFLWWVAGHPALSGAARSAIADEQGSIFVSAATAWEVATKHRIGKLAGVTAIVGDLDRAITNQGFVGMPITVHQGQVAGALPGHHRDPFDRMLVAQAMLEKSRARFQRAHI